MTRILVTGSSDGIGRQTALELVRDGHEVVLHARNDERARQAREAVPGAAAVVVGDLSSLAQTRALAEAANEAGPYDAVIHNAGVGGGGDRVVTEDGYERIFAVNVLAPYVLTCLMPVPARLVYLTSGLQAQGEVHLEDLQFEQRTWDGMQAYSDSKLWDVALAFAVARLHPATLSNAVDPGWIKTRMGGPGATEELPAGAETQVWLATSDDPAATVGGRYLNRRRELAANPAALEVEVQEQLLEVAGRLTGVQLPRG
ncbi:SDR family NAD(P)-dependent oxidoreductase [Microlunatus flavus]|uniref:NAD(P)-dependent dehydrogenase, short-chain alcohol dehydrogenase family n=1 Tax=Microlunatus flavus TaxID=1036181 RepID=A0A1H9J0B5_9ACTN|nr:SDR family NAD(P)-dependent oxidoreductase [Microlunatus flavus]SEQ80177.1 NAD(P)-dependent dehydrogenase, short-chain alcohol dehydrogenase family [Microlunatus flavus]